MTFLTVLLFGLAAGAFIATLWLQKRLARHRRALKAIASLRTPGAAATARKMADLADGALTPRSSQIPLICVIALAGFITGWAWDAVFRPNPEATAAWTPQPGPLQPPPAAKSPQSAPESPENQMTKPSSCPTVPLPTVITPAGVQAP